MSGFSAYIILPWRATSFFFFFFNNNGYIKKQMSAMPQETGHVCHCSARAKVSLYLGAGFRTGLISMKCV